MTGYESKRAAAQDKLNDDDDTQVYDDALLIAYQSGYYDGKKAAQAKVEGPLHVVCQCDKCKAQQAQEPVAWGVFEGNLHDMFFTEVEAVEMAHLKGSHAEVRPLYTAPPQEKNNG